MNRFWDGNTTILLVSHELELIQQTCDRVLWLDKGRVQSIGETKEVVGYYRDMVKEVASLG